MGGRTIIIHYNELTELFNTEDFNTTTVHSLLQYAQQRFYEDDVDLFAGPSDCLCDGPYASKPIDDIRLRSINERSEILQQPIHLWFCNCNKLIFVLLTHLVIVCNFLLDGNNGFLSSDTSTTSEQNHTREDQAAQSINIGEKVLFPFYLVV
jgi:hypothetical protein